MELELMDWSFGLVLVAVVVLVVGLMLRHVLLRRQRQRAEKAARHKAYKEWLHSSGMELPKRESRQRRR